MKFTIQLTLFHNLAFMPGTKISTLRALAKQYNLLIMSYVKIWVHAVWGTKHRKPILKPPILQQVCSHIVSNSNEKGI